MSIASYVHTYIVNCASFLVGFLDCTTTRRVVWGYCIYYSMKAKQVQFVRVASLIVTQSVACNGMYCVSWLHMTLLSLSAQGCIGVCRWWTCWYFRFCSWSWLELVHGLLHLHTRRSSSIWDTSEYHHCCELTLVFSAEFVLYRDQDYTTKLSNLWFSVLYALKQFEKTSGWSRIER